MIRLQYKKWRRFVILFWRFGKHPFFCPSFKYKICNYGRVER